MACWTSWPPGCGLQRSESPDSVPSEFELIARHFTRGTSHTLLGVGDDGALIAPTPGCELVISTDMLVEGTHFLPDTDAADLGWKALAVNVSDIAAMGARPRWATLAVALPDADEAWIAAFARGVFACAGEFGIDLIGGDTTRGPRNFCVTIFGEVESGCALRRSGAKPCHEERILRAWTQGLALDSGPVAAEDFFPQSLRATLPALTAELEQMMREQSQLMEGERNAEATARQQAGRRVHRPPRAVPRCHPGQRGQAGAAAGRVRAAHRPRGGHRRGPAGAARHRG